MPSRNYTVSFSIVTSDTVQLEVSACSEQEAAQLARNILSPELEDHQYLQLEDVSVVYSPLTTSTNNTGYTSLSSFYQSAASTQEDTSLDEPIPFSPTPGYSRLIN